MSNDTPVKAYTSAVRCEVGSNIQVTIEYNGSVDKSVSDKINSILVKTAYDINSLLCEGIL